MPDGSRSVLCGWLAPGLLALSPMVTWPVMPAASAGEKESALMEIAPKPEHTNALIDSTSPYLLQHAHNPVDWYPWGAEALEKARQQNKPIFLSIGYAACHWCHVMERESFENEQIAELLNKHFVCIKVDREERPDLDEVYMTATRIYNQGQGGWPMSVFLTPQLEPFFAGTYFPPTSRWGRPGFGELIERIAGMWESDRQQLLAGASALTDAVRRMATMESQDTPVTGETVSTSAGELARHFDRQYGGLPGGGDNKFPPSAAMALLLREYGHTVEAGQPKHDYLHLVRITLDHMARGGIYDQLGGGVARYSTDRRWLVPHFEKMLYDQALVADVYLEAYQVTGDKFYAKVAADIFDYVLEDLQSPQGGFYSTRDADSQGQEGKYYVWTLAEIEQVLGREDAKLLASYYDVSEAGNWEGRNILNVPRAAETVASLNGLSVEQLERRLRPLRERLRAARRLREPPGLDDKILTAWNGLMIASLAKGARVLDEAKYAEGARRAADFLLGNLRREGRLLRTYREGRAHTSGFLSDYAFFIEGLLNLYEATFEVRWLEAAFELNETLMAHYYDEQGGGFFYTADDAEKLLVRSKDPGDEAVPSGNSVQLLNMYRLALLFGREDWRDRAEQTSRFFGAQCAENPFAYERFLCAVDFQLSGPKEIALVGPKDDPTTRELVRAVYRGFLPHKVVVLWDPASPDAAWLARNVPWLAGKGVIEGRSTAYVCRNRVCRRPVTTPEGLSSQLR